MSPLCQIGMTLPADSAGVSGVTIRLMSDRELSRFEVLRDLDRGRLTAPAAAQLLRLERRQVFRLLRAYRAEGAAGLISKRRGRASNRAKPEALRTKVLAIIRERYWDFGPNPGGGEAGRAARDRTGSRDAAPMDDRGRAVA